MNRKRIFSVVLMLCLIFAFSYAEIKESDLYYMNVRVVRIFPHSKGYYVIYQKSGLETGEVFIPMKWFKPGDKKATYEETNARIDPYLTYYTKNGEFHHIKLVAPKNPKSTVWGRLRSPKDYDEKFNIETIKLEF